MKKIIVLGCSGFIGTALCKVLATAYPDCELIGFSSSDLNLLDRAALNQLAVHASEDTVVVFCSMLKKEVGDSLDVYEQNVKMMIHFTDFLREHSFGRIVYLSSAAVYGEEINNVSITEQTLLQPTSYYGLAKCASENLLRKAVHDQDKHDALLILRPPLVYGAHDRSRAYGPAGFTKKALAGESIVLWGDGTELREFLYIDDLVAVMTQLCIHKFSGVLNVVAGQRYCFKDILDIMPKYIDQPLDLQQRERSKTKVDNAFDNQLLQSVLPDFVFTILEDGVMKTIQAESGVAS